MPASKQAFASLCVDNETDATLASITASFSATLYAAARRNCQRTHWNWAAHVGASNGNVVALRSSLQALAAAQTHGTQVRGENGFVFNPSGLHLLWSRRGFMDLDKMDFRLFLGRDVNNRFWCSGHWCGQLNLGRLFDDWWWCRILVIELGCIPSK